MQTLAGLL